MNSRNQRKNINIYFIFNYQFCTEPDGNQTESEAYFKKSNFVVQLSFTETKNYIK